MGDEALDDVAGEPWAKKLCIALSPRPEMSSSCTIFQPPSFAAGDVPWTMNAGAAGYGAPLDDLGANGHGTTVDGVQMGELQADLGFDRDLMQWTPEAEWERRHLEGFDRDLTFMMDEGLMPPTGDGMPQLGGDGVDGHNSNQPGLFLPISGAGPWQAEGLGVAGCGFRINTPRSADASVGVGGTGLGWLSSPSFVEGSSGFEDDAIGWETTAATTPMPSTLKESGPDSGGSAPDPVFDTCFGLVSTQNSTTGAGCVVLTCPAFHRGLPARREAC